jgi:hypothetical protein
MSAQGREQPRKARPLAAASPNVPLESGPAAFDQGLPLADTKSLPLQPLRFNRIAQKMLVHRT